MSPVVDSTAPTATAATPGAPASTTVAPPRPVLVGTHVALRLISRGRS